MGKVYRGVYAARTDRGRVRNGNEDQASAAVNADDEVFLIVADGVGGFARGELASKMAVDSLLESFRAKRRSRLPFLDRLFFRRAIREANSLIFETARGNEDNCGNMSTTLVCALISGSRLWVASIGDSRAYLLQDGKLVPLTEDESYVQALVRAGKISEKEASVHPKRHIILNALGVYPSVSFTLSYRKYRGEPILLCSDGLYTQVREEDIAQVLLTDQRPEQKAMSLILQANMNGGSDNVAISYWEAFPHD